MTPIVATYRAPARGIAPLADIYEPAAPTGASIVLVHGGGFVIGSRRMKPMRFLATRLAAAGITVCSVDYRLIFRGGRLDEAIDDVRAALAFWRGRAPDPERITLVGLSAGATLSLRVAARDPVARLACCFGLYEVAHVPVLPRLLFRTSDRNAWQLAAHPQVPTLLLHGDRDRLVPVAQARRLAAHREALGLPTRLVIYDGARHGFFRAPSPTADAGVRELVHWSDGRS